MSSSTGTRHGTPRSIQWAQLFALPERSTLPLQGRLRQAIVQTILDGRLTIGAPLPSSRELARASGEKRSVAVKRLH